MKIISTKNGNINFVLYKKFKSNLFSPIGKYVSWKLENNWDDYDELYHSLKYIEEIKKTKGVWFEIHTIEQDNEIKGVLTIVGGAIEKLDTIDVFENENTILLKYFHIVEKGKGYGSYWLNSVIIPYYSKKEFQNIYISSSHPKSFNFYNKIGSEIKSYTKKSDNQLYERTCKSFLIPLNK